MTGGAAHIQMVDTCENTHTPVRMSESMYISQISTDGCVVLKVQYLGLVDIVCIIVNNELKVLFCLGQYPKIGRPFAIDLSLIHI